MRELFILVLVDAFSTHQFGQVHVSENSHDDGRLAVLRVQPLECPQSTEYRQDVAQTKIVVHLEGRPALFFYQGGLLYKCISQPIQKIQKHKKVNPNS